MSVTPRDPAFDGQGHLSELSLDRVHLDTSASDPAFFARAERHLAGCARCRAAIDARVAADRSFTLAPRSAAIRGPSARGRTWTATVTVFALAAGVLIATRPGGTTDADEPGDGIRVRGGALALEVQVHDGRAARAVADGDAIRAGERVGFAVRVERAGHLLVVGWDDGGAVYPVHPAGPGAVEAVAVAPSATPVALPSAVEVDATPGRERFAAIWCPEPFGFATVGAPLAAADPAGVEALRARGPGGCAVRALALVKAGP